MSPFSSINDQCYRAIAIVHSLDFCDILTGEWDVRYTINVAQGGVDLWLAHADGLLTCGLTLLSLRLWLVCPHVVPRFWRSMIRVRTTMIVDSPHFYWASLWHAPPRAPRCKRRTDIPWSRIYFAIYYPTHVILVESLPTILISLTFG